MIVVMVVVVVMLRRVWDRACGANRCAWCRLLYVKVENVFRHDAKARVWLWQL